MEKKLFCNKEQIILEGFGIHIMKKQFSPSLKVGQAKKNSWVILVFRTDIKKDRFDRIRTMLEKKKKETVTIFDIILKVKD